MFLSYSLLISEQTLNLIFGYKDAYLGIYLRPNVYILMKKTYIFQIMFFEGKWAYSIDHEEIISLFNKSIIQHKQ